MKKYTKPVAQVVELSVKESISALTTKSQSMFGFNDKNVTLTTYAVTENSLTIEERADA